MAPVGHWQLREPRGPVAFQPTNAALTGLGFPFDCPERSAGSALSVGVRTN